MSQPFHDGEVRRLATRLRRIAAGIARAHASGHGPGHQVSIPSVAVVELVLGDRPEESVTGAAWALGRYYRSATYHLLARGAPEGLAEEWVSFVDTVRKVADALLAVAEGRAPMTSEAASDEVDLAQTIDLVANVTNFPFDRIAELVSADNTRRMVEVASRIERALAPPTEANPLSRDERRLMRAVVAGETIDQIADRLGLSTRTIHRRLQTIWARVGASSRTEGIAIVSIRGWLDHPT